MQRLFTYENIKKSYHSHCRLLRTQLVDKPLCLIGIFIMEIWKTIKDFENYQVSNLGRIKSFTKGSEKILKTALNTNKYYWVRLFNKDKSKCKLVHSLVAEYFLENKLNLPFINHIDGCKTNNKVFNLEWCTQKQNVNHAWSLGLNKISEKQIILFKERVSIKVIDTKTNKIFSSIKEAADFIGMNKTTLGTHLNNKVKNKTTLKIYGKTI